MNIKLDDFQFLLTPKMRKARKVEVDHSKKRLEKTERRFKKQTKTKQLLTPC